MPSDGFTFEDAVKQKYKCKQRLIEYIKIHDIAERAQNQPAMISERENMNAENYLKDEASRTSFEREVGSDEVYHEFMDTGRLII